MRRNCDHHTASIRQSLKRFAKGSIIIIVEAVGLGVIFAAVWAFFFPQLIGREEALLILQTLIGLDGALIGFAGIIGTILVTNPHPFTQISMRGVMFSMMAASIWFIISILICILFIAQLTGQSSMRPYGILAALYFMSLGVISLFRYAQKASRVFIATA